MDGADNEKSAEAQPESNAAPTLNGLKLSDRLDPKR